MIQTLEKRELLAGDLQLITVSPNFGDFVTDGTQLTQRPRELTFQFTPGEAIDATTLNGIRIVGSGFDDSFSEGNEIPVSRGFVGIGDSPDQVVFRFGQTLQDDRYRITILGNGPARLRNEAGDAFNNGVNLSFEFDLDLGATVQGVNPQPVVRSQTIEIADATQLTDGDTITVDDGAGPLVFELNVDADPTVTDIPIEIASTDLAPAVATAVADAINNATFLGQGVTATANGSKVVVTGNAVVAGSVAPNASVSVANSGAATAEASITQLRKTIIVHFNDDQLSQAVAEDPKFYKLIDTADTLSATDNTIILPESVAYDAVGNHAVLTFANDIPTGTYRLRIGTSNESNGSIADAINVGTLFSSAGFSHTGFIGDEDGTDDVDLYAVDLSVATALTVSVDPDANLDAVIEIFNSSGVLVSTVVNASAADVLEMVTIPLGPGVFYVGVSSEGNESYTPVDGAGNTGGTSSGSYRIDLAVTASVSASDTNSSYATATDLGVLGVAETVLSSQIEPQTSVLVPLYPGATDEPGHREIPAEVHGSASPPGTGLTAPDAIDTIEYYFPVQYGTNPSGLPLFNEITENQKERTREIFEIFASLYGIEVRETTGSGLQIITGDPREIHSIAPITSSFYSGNRVIISGFIDHGSSPFGGGWFDLALENIGRAIGPGRPIGPTFFSVTGSEGSFELPSVAGNGTLGEDEYPGNHDIVHGMQYNRPDANDIDMYRFDVREAGTITAEIVAERLSMSSLLDSSLRLYREEADGTRTLVSQNDDYFGDDAFIELDVDAPGTYYIGVSSTGNTDYDPIIADSGFGGLSDGSYQLKLNFSSLAPSAIVDTTGKRLDGNADGFEGGTFEFDFRSDNTIFVDKTVITNLAQPVNAGQTAIRVNDLSVFPSTAGFDILIGNETMTVTAINASTKTLTVTRGTPTLNHAINTAVRPASADGGEANPFGLISSALAAAGPGDIVRIVANAGADNDLSTTDDNLPYLIGRNDSFVALEDGRRFEVPADVVVQIDPGTTIKLQAAVIDAGSSSLGEDRSGGSVQVLGTPDHSVILTAYGNDAIGGDDDGITDGAKPGDWGGIVYRGDSDFVAIDAATNPNALPITLNYVNHANISYGGGLVAVNGANSAYTPIHIVDARPTVSYNTISNAALGALSANANSFSDSGGRIGPDFVGNILLNNTTNGVIVRSDNSTGSDDARLSVSARFDDTDVVHVLADNLEIAGNPGNQINPANTNQVLPSGRLAIDPGVVVKLSSSRIEGGRGGSNLIAEGTPQDPIIFTSLLDDRFGGGGSFDTTGNGSQVLAAPGDWSGLVLNAVSTASIDNVLIAYGGGESPIAGQLAKFNAVEAQHRASLRLANSTLQFNADGNASGDRDGRGTNTAATVFLRQVQPIIINNVFTDNNGSIIDINANALTSEVVKDSGRSRGPISVGSRRSTNAQSGT